MAQRLLRRICPDCKQPYQPSVNELRELGIGQNLPENIKFYIGAGCEKCFDTGYRGRIGIYELMIIDEQIREMIYQKESAGAIKKKAISLGLQTLRMDGARKVAQGVTSIAEVLRVTQADTI
jgi:type II secretory ATPase GspE/PulE/Tfp pilus assembly ATPase PilB-like protein